MAEQIEPTYGREEEVGKNNLALLLAYASAVYLKKAHESAIVRCIES
jgi:hypothetical protein